MTIDAGFVPKLAKKVRLRFDRHEQKHMLIYPERGLVLNDAAAAIAERCDGTRSISAIAAELASAHDGDPAAIEQDVVAFVADLEDKGLLER
jgi:pyrroloquinoline quinone biosynthesis protein D